jgi:hypothetical protein
MNAVIGLTVLHIPPGVLSDGSKHVGLALQLQTSIHAETRGRDSDDRIWLLFKRQRHAYRCGISAVQPLPQTITDDGDGCRSGPVVVRSERASTKNLDTKHRQNF